LKKEFKEHKRTKNLSFGKFAKCTNKWLSENGRERAQDNSLSNTNRKYLGTEFNTLIKMNNPPI